MVDPISANTVTGRANGNGVTSASRANTPADPTASAIEDARKNLGPIGPATTAIKPVLEPKKLDEEPIKNMKAGRELLETELAKQIIRNEKVIAVEGGHARPQNNLSDDATVRDSAEYKKVVEFIQTSLKQQGLYNPKDGKSSGVYDAETAAAVEAYAKSKGHSAETQRDKAGTRVLSDLLKDFAAVEGATLTSIQGSRTAPAGQSNTGASTSTEQGTGAVSGNTTAGGAQSRQQPVSQEVPAVDPAMERARKAFYDGLASLNKQLDSGPKVIFEPGVSIDPNKALQDPAAKKSLAIMLREFGKMVKIQSLSSIDPEKISDTQLGTSFVVYKDFVATGPNPKSFSETKYAIGAESVTALARDVGAID